MITNKQLINILACSEMFLTFKLLIIVLTKMLSIYPNSVTQFRCAYFPSLYSLLQEEQVTTGITSLYICMSYPF